MSPDDLPRGISHVASNIRVAGGKENAFGQRSLSNMQIARLVPFGVNIKSEALTTVHCKALTGTAAIGEVERLQALPEDRPELSSGFGIVSERGDILAYSPTWDGLHVYSRATSFACLSVRSPRKLKSVLLRKFHKSGRTGFLPNLESLFVADWIQEESTQVCF